MKIVSDCFNFVTTVKLSYQAYKCIRHSSLFHICLSHSGGAKILVWGGGTSDKISYMNSSQVLYCNGVPKIWVLKRHSARMYSSNTLKNFEKFIKQFAQNLKNSPKFFQK